MNIYLAKFNGFYPVCQSDALIKARSKPDALRKLREKFDEKAEKKYYPGNLNHKNPEDTDITIEKVDTVLEDFGPVLILNNGNY